VKDDKHKSHLSQNKTDTVFLQLSFVEIKNKKSAVTQKLNNGAF